MFNVARIFRTSFICFYYMQNILFRQQFLKRKMNILRTKEDLIKEGLLNKGVNMAGEETSAFIPLY